VEPSKSEWTADVDLLRLWHSRLRTYARAVPARRLNAKSASHTFTIAEVISGAGAHDLYHAG